MTSDVGVPTVTKSSRPSGVGIDLRDLEDAVTQASASNSDTVVIRLVGMRFSSIEGMKYSFLKDGDPDPSDEDSGVNLDSVAEAYRLLATRNEGVARSLFNAFQILATEFQATVLRSPQPLDLRPVLIMLLNPALLDPDYHAVVVAKVCSAIDSLPSPHKRRLTTWFERFSANHMAVAVHALQQFITLQFYSSERVSVNSIQPAIELLGMLSAANDHAFSRTGRHIIDFREFYNDVVNEETSLREDYRRWLQSRDLVARGAGKQFSFCDYSFLLDAAAKASILQLDATVQQRSSFMRSVLGHGTSPHLVLSVRRSEVLSDTLHQIAAMPTEQFKKPLKVKFKGEEGVDEGGVRKEFFQVLLRELFDQRYAMFTIDDSTRLMWFNGHSLEANLQFELVGILLGLAIYNAVILDVHFPLVVYRKLRGLTPTLRDLEEVFPDEASGLQSVLDYEGDVAADMDLRFDVDTEVWGEIKTIELKPGGSETVVTAENRQEYVDLYVKYMLTSSVERQFGAFYRGFHKVCGGATIELFRPEELEQLVCGSKELDFEALESGAVYDDGFTAESPTIRMFWEVLHTFTEADKKKVLSFATGSDRAPIKGLGSLRFVISRMGPDSELLPTSHTCFNHLLLPEYSSKAKLETKLRAAISQAEGFGLL